MIETSQPDIIIATEWLQPDILDSELCCENYDIYRKDRKSDAHGGVLIAVNQHITSNIIKIKTTHDSEIIWVKVKCRFHKDIIIGGCYRPNVSDTKTLADLRESVESLHQRKRSFGLILAGDFNLPGWDWTNRTLKPKTPYPSLHHDFMALVDDAYLVQHVEEPTRKENTLDLICTNLSDQVNRVKVIPGISDHDIVYMELSVKPKSKIQKPREIYLYQKADWDGMRDYLGPILDRLEKSYQPCANTLWTTIKDHLIEAANLFIPKKLCKRRKSQPWVSKSLRKKMKKRDKIFKRSRRYGDSRSEDRYLQLKREIQRQLRQEHRNYLNSLFEGTDTKRFWTYIKNKSTTTTSIGPLKNDGILISDAREMAGILNTQFQSVFSSPDNDYTKLYETQNPQKMLEIVIDKHGVMKQLKSLNPYKSCGPDNLSPMILKELADILAGPLTTLFQTSLNSARVPDDWKQAVVCPLFKKGEKYEPANYRPISLTCVTCKVMEHIIASQLMRFAESTELFSDKQHGFRRNRSCETQLIELLSDISKQLDGGHEVDACVLDFAKAFDKVNHCKLVHKLYDYGVSYQTCSWIKEFLNGRSQRVVVDGETSEEEQVTSGVPQGSVLGPILFLFYINDLPDGLSSCVRLFADDTILYNSSANIDALQEDLTILENWEQKWDMSFNATKCEHILFSRKRTPTEHPLTIHNTTIPRTKQTKYLGVLVDDGLTFKQHVASITGKASSKLGLLRRNVQTSSQEIKAMAYKQMIRPTLEYASAAWDRLGKSLEKDIEAIQRRAARTTCNINITDRTTSTTKLLADLEWDPLATRRKHRRLVVFNSYHHQRQNIILEHLNPKVTHNNRRHNEQYLIPHCSTKHHQKSFFIRTGADWNCLPPDSQYLVHRQIASS